MGRRTLPAILAVALLAACSPPSPTIDPQVRNELLAKVAQIRNAATRGDRAAAEVQLRALSSEVSTDETQGRLSAAFAHPILLAADRVAEDVRTLAPPAPVTAITPPPRTAEPPHSQQQEKGKGKRGHGG